MATSLSRWFVQGLLGFGGIGYEKLKYYARLGKMNILTFYLSNENKDLFEKFLMTFCKRIDDSFYYYDYFININEFILKKLDDGEIANIKNYMGDFITYSIVWKNLNSLYDLLNKINLYVFYLIDNDNGELIKNDDFCLMDFSDFSVWAQKI